LVSSSSTTGKKEGIDGTTDYFQRVQNMKLKSPTLIGFNIKDSNSYQTACEFSQGAIIGSAFIKALNNGGNLKDSIENFIKSIR
jgi:tryptophan synthase alpha chain